MEVTATATRSGGWWAVEVDVAGGIHTQARRLDQVPAMVADAVSLVEAVDADDVQVRVVPVLDEALDAILAQARSAMREVNEVSARSSALAREAVACGRSQGLTVRDVGVLLEVSPQRVSQLAAHA